MVNILEKDKRILEIIRDLYRQSGGNPLYKPEDFGGLNEYYKSKSGKYEVSFNYGVPQKLYTPDGSYTILGSSVVGNLSLFWKLFCDTFAIDIIKPARDDSITDYAIYQLSTSGLIVSIELREEIKNIKT